nr:vitelline membrane outer layer protein 1 homolog [Procambarus clarkii]
MCSSVTTLLLVTAAALTAGVRAVNVTSVITAPRTVLVGEKLYLPCQAEGIFLTCGWDSPLDEIIYPEDLTDPDGPIVPFPGFNCGIIVNEVTLEDSGHWACIATVEDGFDAQGGDVTVRPVSSWPGVVANVSSPLAGVWGEWGEVQLCPANAFAVSLELKSEAPTTGDNTAANGLLLPCRQQGGALPTAITSSMGDFGTWRGLQYCPIPEYIDQFQLRVEPENAFDDTAVNDIKFTCTHYPEEVLSGGGETWGEWGDWASCPPDTAVCGIQTKVEPYLGVSGDDTALNDVRFFCCPTVW